MPISLERSRTEVVCVYQSHILLSLVNEFYFKDLISKAELEELKAKEFILDFSAPGSETFFENLNVEEKIEVVRFMVPIEEWKEKGVKA